MGGLEDLYQQLILDHYRAPRHRGTLDNVSVAVDHDNPLCGDQLHLELLIDDGRVVAIAHSGEGCSISQSSASMMADAVSGMSTDDALALVEHFRLMMHGTETGDEDRLGDAIALEGVARYPVRIKCALLSWMALKDAVQTYSAKER